MAVNYKAEFSQSISDIEALIEVPDTIKKFATDQLKKFDVSGLKNTEKNNFKNLITSIENIEEESIREQYKVIYNQLCILLVSASAAILEKYFLNYSNTNPKKLNDKELERLKITLIDLKEYDFKAKSSMGNIILNLDNSINFQDLQSTKGTFLNYLGKDFTLSEDLTKKIIFFQQCRHILVHKNSVIDEEFIEKVSKHDANLNNLNLNDKIQLSSNDWVTMKAAFTSLIAKLIPSYLEPS